RRHTRSTRDWSSDVCSSDLDEPAVQLLARAQRRLRALPLRHVAHERADVHEPALVAEHVRVDADPLLAPVLAAQARLLAPDGVRSEERRVGKGWTPGGAPER